MKALIIYGEIQMAQIKSIVVIFFQIIHVGIM